jgi:hypothetical protein
VLADTEALKTLTSPFLIDVRVAKEIADKPMVPGAVNVVWNKAAGKFDNPAALPADKSTTLVIY